MIGILLFPGSDDLQYGIFVGSLSLLGGLLMIWNVILGTHIDLSLTQSILNTLFACGELQLMFENDCRNERERTKILLVSMRSFKSFYFCFANERNRKYTFNNRSIDIIKKHRTKGRKTRRHARSRSILSIVLLALIVRFRLFLFLFFCCKISMHIHYNHKRLL